MNKINQLIYEYIDEYVDVFIKSLSENYNISYTEIKNKWINFVETNHSVINTIVEPGETIKDEKDKKTIKDEKTTKDEKDKKTTKDEKTAKDEKDKKTTMDEIVKEIVKDNKTIKEIKNKKVWGDNEDGNEEEEEIVVRKKNKTPIYSGILIHFNKMIKKYIHKESKMVFYSKNELVVYCKLSDDNRLCELTEDDKEICKKLKFRMDSSLYDEREAQRIYEENNINKDQE